MIYDLLVIVIKKVKNEACIQTGKKYVSQTYFLSLVFFNERCKHRTLVLEISILC